MICASLSFFFLSLLTLVELTRANTRKFMCGENMEIPIDCNDDFCDPNSEIVNMTLKFLDKAFLEMTCLINVDQNCSEDGRICLKVAKDRKCATLTIRDVTFTDEGRYDLYIERSDANIQTIFNNVLVYGMCEPIVSQSEDELTCEGTLENTSIPTIDWMSKERKRYPSVLIVEKRTEDYIWWRITLKLTDETRQMIMCCTVSYTQSKSEEKQNCLPDTARSYKQNANNTRTKIIIPILFVLCFAIGVALYVYYRPRPSFTRRRRARTVSGQGLISDIENTQEKKETQSDPLQRPEKQSL